jgi:hemolysin-activating ACP:hemolysin acyltransferase
VRWHTDVTIGDLHYLRSKFAHSQGLDAIFLGSFNKATEVFFSSKQFAVNGNHFLTWAFLTPEWEINYLSGKMDWLDHVSHGNPWVVEAFAPSMTLSAMRELRQLIPEKTLRFCLGRSKVRRINLP